MDNNFNKNCLKIIFSKLIVEELYRIKAVCKKFSVAVDEMLGVSIRMPRVEKLNEEIKNLRKQIKGKEKQIFDDCAAMSAKKQISEKWNRAQLVELIERFNTMYGKIEGTVDPKYVLQGLDHIRYLVIYEHDDECANVDPFESKECSCPIKSIHLNFHCPDPNSERMLPFQCNYVRDNYKPWDGFFRGRTLKDFDKNRLIEDSWMKSHMIEHILYRVSHAEISYRKLHHDDADDNDSDDDA